MSNFCFVSYEIAPTTKGGAGSLIANVIQVLLEKEHHVALLLDLNRFEFDKFTWHDRCIRYQNSHLLNVYQVDELTGDIDRSRENFSSEFEWRSYRFFWALKKITIIETLDSIEFFDYAGVAYYSLLAKITSDDFKNVHLAVRIHTTLEAIDLEEPQTYYDERHLLYSLERQSLRLADTVLYPSKTYFEKTYEYLYEENWLGTTIYSPPPVIDIPKFIPDTNQHIILFYGRIETLKGADRFVNASLQLLNEYPDRTLKFVMVGSNLKKGPEGFTTYEDYLISKIPPMFRDQFEFSGHINRNQLCSLLPEVLFAVFPNYLESFGYAVHELYNAGIPIIVSKIPAFEDFFQDQKNALVFDGTIENLVEKMKLMLFDSGLRNKLKKPFPVIIKPLGDFYDEQPKGSWIDGDVCSSKNESSLLILIMADGSNSHLLRNTLQKVNGTGKVIVLSKKSNPIYGAARFMNQLCWAYDENLNVINTIEIRTEENLLILESGDEVDCEWMRESLSTLEKHKKVSFVGSWREVSIKGKKEIKIFPVDAAIDMLPFLSNFKPTRMIMRTDKGKDLFDLFDNRLQQFGEIDYLWHLNQYMGPGVMIPVVGVSIVEKSSEILPYDLLSLLFFRSSLYMQRRLGHYYFAKFLASNQTPPVTGSVTEQEILDLKLAKIDLQLLLKNLSKPPLGWLLRLKRNFRILFKRYING